jgi:hypothetical protein
MLEIPMSDPLVYSQTTVHVSALVNVFSVFLKHCKLQRKYFCRRLKGKLHRLPNTNKMQANIQISMAVSPSALGEFVVMLLNMLMSTRNSVMSNAILPEMTQKFIC